MKFLVLAAVALLAAAPPPPATVPRVELDRYMGRWYEIAAFANFAQKGCADTVVYYKLDGDGGFHILNTCWKGQKFKPYKGRAKPEEKGSTSKFYARFFLLLGSPYWIVDLDAEYRWAAVSGPARDRLWIISREPTLDPKVYDAMLERLRKDGFDTDKLVRTSHSGRQTPAGELKELEAK